VASALAAVGLAACIGMIFTVVPNDEKLFFNQRIFYFHIAHSLNLFIAVIVCGACSVAFLWKRKPAWDDIALASAEIAVAFGAVVLINGRVWAKAAWGRWWVWENRLAMSLLLWLTLVAYVLVRRYAGGSADRLAAGLAVFSTVAIPFIYTMVNKGDQHPQAGANGNALTLHGDMRTVMWLSVATFLFWFLALLGNRVGSARAERELRELREKSLDAGLLT
jgi:heme exporter protein C